mmetsp:Transcript_17804/g.27516  ORF Transcript_17804/g.27516 Transcript_17804/m.27516 type:complete len:200 (+) Transcript_17804:1062-1661(+)
MIPSQALVLPCLARRLSAMLNVMRLPSVSCVSFIVSRTLTVSSSSPQTSQAFTTVLKIRKFGLSALPCLDSSAQSRRREVAFLLFSALAQQVTTLLQTLGEGVNPRANINSKIFTASFHEESAEALMIARRWIIVAARWAAGDAVVTNASPRSGSQPFALLAAVKNRSPRPILSSFSAAMTPAANRFRPSTVEAIPSSS